LVSADLECGSANFYNTVQFYGLVKNFSGNIQFTSDKNLKNSIKYLSDKETNILYKLKPVVFKYNHDLWNKIHFGLIAQDVEKAMIESGLFPN